MIGRSAVGLLAAAGVLAVAGCGSSDDNGGSGAATQSSSSSSSSMSSGQGGYGSAARGTNSTSTSSSSAAPAGAVKLSAASDGSLRFDKTKLTAKAGKVTIAMMDPGSSGQEHGIAVEGHGVDKDGKIVQPGGTSTITLNLKPGTYEFYCPVPGHEDAGMKGTLTVQ